MSSNAYQRREHSIDSLLLHINDAYSAAVGSKKHGISYDYWKWRLELGDYDFGGWGRHILRRLYDASTSRRESVRFKA